MGPYLGAQLWRLALTILTFGLYGFWWKTASRSRLWADTRVDGDALAYRGRGMELFAGALPLVALMLVVLLLSAELLRHGLTLAWVAVPLVVVLPWLIGFAGYRARRYGLSRTSWRGMSAGMRHNEAAYAWLNLRLTLLSLVTLGFATPYVEARRWNSLWGDTFCGAAPVEAQLDWRELQKSFWPAYLGSIVAFGLAFAIGFEGFELALGALRGDAGATLAPSAGFALVKFYGYLAIAFAASAFLLLGYRAHFQQEAVASVSVGGLYFDFAATTKDWVRFHAGNAALVVLTLGLGMLLLRVRRWRFWMANLELYGALDTVAAAQTVSVRGNGRFDGFRESVQAAD